MVITMAKLRIATPPRVAHAKPPGPKEIKRPNDGNNNGQATHGARKPPGPKSVSARFKMRESVKIGIG